MEKNQKITLSLLFSVLALYQAQNSCAAAGSNQPSTRQRVNNIIGSMYSQGLKRVGAAADKARTQISHAADVVESDFDKAIAESIAMAEARAKELTKYEQEMHAAYEKALTESAAMAQELKTKIERREKEELDFALAESRKLEALRQRKEEVTRALFIADTAIDNGSEIQSLEMNLSPNAIQEADKEFGAWYLNERKNRALTPEELARKKVELLQKHISLR